MAVVNPSPRLDYGAYPTDPASGYPLRKSATEHAFFKTFSNPPSFGAYHESKPLSDRVYEVGITMLKFLVFLLQPKLFIIGFVCGIVWDQTCHSAVEKIKAVWTQQSFVGKTLIVVGGLLGLPSVFLAACFLTAASLGGQCHQGLCFD